MATDYKHILDHMNPPAKYANLGKFLYGMANSVNAALKRLDAAGTALVAAAVTATITDAGIAAGDSVSLTITNAAINGLPVTVHYVLQAGDTVASIAAGLVALIKNNAVLQAANFTASNAAGVITIDQPGTVGNSTVVTEAVTGAVVCTLGGSTAGHLAGGAGTFGTDNYASFKVLLPEDLAAIYGS